MKDAEDFIKAHSEVQFKKQEKIEVSNELLEFDQLKTRILKYVLYKKRTEQEVRTKFSSSQNANLIDDVIDNLKENGYINDKSYIERAINEFMAINTLSLKEMKNKLYIKGLNSNLTDSYFAEHIDELEEYERNCAKKIILKKQTQLEKEEIERFLYKKGYSSSQVRKAYEEIEE